jgi:hypothetical protein
VVPLSIEPLTGWRAWRLAFDDDDGPTLVSLNRRDRWPVADAMRAACPRSHRPPDATCSCGIYAKWSQRRLRRLLTLNQRADVVGTLSCWGQIVEHRRGMRAELAYPSALAIVCGRCRDIGLGPVRADVVRRSGPRVTAACSRHGRKGEGWTPAKDLELELRSRYGVDRLPLDPPARLGLVFGGRLWWAAEQGGRVLSVIMVGLVALLTVAGGLLASLVGLSVVLGVLLGIGSLFVGDASTVPPAARTAPAAAPATAGHAPSFVTFHHPVLRSRVVLHHAAEQSVRRVGLAARSRKREEAPDPKIEGPSVPRPSRPGRADQATQFATRPLDQRASPIARRSMKLCPTSSITT